MFDEEGNGLVKTDELEKLMSLMGINPTKRELATMAKEVDKDNKGTLNCDSFLVLMGIYHEKAKNQDEELRAAFKVFDKEHKGYIDWNTLKYVLMNAGEPLNEQEAELMMKEADKDGDGTIDYEEICCHSQCNRKALEKYLFMVWIDIKRLVNKWLSLMQPHCILSDLSAESSRSIQQKEIPIPTHY
ncbi:calmodulin-like protein 6 isoform X2 [Mauremys mutica]|nr:calmodulin-like protein 6 isoform X3 [Mauremys reevesii]XP_039365130.1 calmodulin-like protein 6 isoform X3 [Mauremys reevesii]XP_039365131.1 calmodulin-like protein 6 isoform X3 [Mauremys reevesii]XP_039365132.1 calmodulin-like protein 6 isoform X3 [Mauremys reevesii]XP_039365133.1 calmodulin-like protein 6 isoform X3 [Mauremys reevesii]XP_039365134.1 calmodulin-like protein 6 isoform X3 [Mauremys reevesii]XP_039365135.1 calmodulin-like protein 6 isoform X3 [Mauremys reevesii]XP_03936513